MKIEDVTIEDLERTIKRTDNVSIRKLRMRFVQIYEKYFENNEAREVVMKSGHQEMSLTRSDLLEKYSLVLREIKQRKLDVGSKAIDTEIMKSFIWGFNISSLPDSVLVPGFISVGGDYIRSPKSTESIDIVIKSSDECRDEELEAKLSDIVKSRMGKEPNFIYSPEGPEGDHIPLFSLMIQAEGEMRKVKGDEGEEFDIKKPYPNEHSCRLREPDEFKDKPWGRTERTSDGKRYSIITGRLKDETTGTEQAYRYDKDTWTEAQARAHCKDHDGILFEPAKEVKKKDITIKKPEETENTIRIPVGPECEVTATIDIDKNQGITALYCGKIKKIRAYQFDKRVKAWTMASAKAWVKENHEKTEKSLGKEKKEKIAVFKIMKIDRKQQIAGGVVYEPDIVDSQGDMASAEEIQKAMYKFMEKYATETKRIRVMHKGKMHYFPIVECFQPEHDMMKGGKTVKAGSWWLMVKILNKQIWDQVVDGKLTGFSMGGRAKA